MHPVRIAVSVVSEWENMSHAGADRPRRMLAALVAQARLLAEDGTAPVRLRGPLEVVLPFDSETTDERSVLDAVRGAGIPCGALRIRALAVPGGTYCGQKNAGALAATGEIVVLLDSDVVPEPGWLMAFLLAFTDPRVSVAVGNTYVDHSRGDAYSRAMALTWMFPLRDADAGVRPSGWFYANNAAFRRSTFLAHPFRDVPGLKHAAARTLVAELDREGIPIWHVGGARASHPAPRGASHFVERAVSAGRARALSRCEPVARAVTRWAREDILNLGWNLKRLLRERRRVDLPIWQLPAATGYPLAYYPLITLGSLLTVLAAGFMRNRFQL